MLKNRHLIDPMDFTVDQLEEIFELAHQIIKNPKEYAKVCDGKILATL
ncbi:MAG: aspartate carbamoyltransferase, partial [Clostridium baratii]|nr:aspartate carbamoyltransferase [Clostridium baratii]